LLYQRLGLRLTLGLVVYLVATFLNSPSPAPSAYLAVGHTPPLTRPTDLADTDPTPVSGLFALPRGPVGNCTAIDLQTTLDSNYVLVSNSNLSINEQVVALLLFDLPPDHRTILSALPVQSEYGTARWFLVGADCVQQGAYILPHTQQPCHDQVARLHNTTREQLLISCESPNWASVYVFGVDPETKEWRGEGAFTGNAADIKAPAGYDGHLTDAAFQKRLLYSPSHLARTDIFAWDADHLVYVLNERRMDFTERPTAPVYPEDSVLLFYEALSEEDNIRANNYLSPMGVLWYARQKSAQDHVRMWLSQMNTPSRPFGGSPPDGEYKVEFNLLSESRDSHNESWQREIFPGYWIVSIQNGSPRLELAVISPTKIETCEYSHNLLKVCSDPRIAGW